MQNIPADWVSREGRGAVAGIIVGLLCGTLLKRVLPFVNDSRHDPSDYDAFSEDEAENHGVSSDAREQKLVFCVRTDLKMQKGKIAAQVGHATLGAYKRALQKNQVAVRHWEHQAQTKIALQIRSEAEARQIERAAKQNGLVTFIVYDAGRTQVAAVSILQQGAFGKK